MPFTKHFVLLVVRIHRNLWIGSSTLYYLSSESTETSESGPRVSLFSLLPQWHSHLCLEEGSVWHEMVTDYGDYGHRLWWLWSQIMLTMVTDYGDYGHGLWWLWSQGLVTMVTEFIVLGVLTKWTQNLYFYDFGATLWFDDCKDFLGTTGSRRPYLYCNSGEATLRIALTLHVTWRGELIKRYRMESIPSSYRGRSSVTRIPSAHSFA